MRAYLRNYELAEKVATDQFADLGKRADAIATLLQYPLAMGTRMDLRRMYLDIHDQLEARAS